ncbi:hypothetical protein LSM04_002289 [Trypanosoma melophagium]|uniref:uncharacterized protein n=1 Tax=Trypanosoma melophagium TaxID=715481 RepID=UPI00351A404B|nr:hypothetical protein LSM04_002289 [Trypanosoma melophagium]
MTRQSDVQECMNSISNRTEKATEVRAYDEQSVEERMRKLFLEIAEKKAADKKKADELAQIPVKNEDVELLMSELGWERAVAEHRLREKKGDTVAIMREVVGLPKAKVSVKTA